MGRRSLVARHACALRPPLVLLAAAGPAGSLGLGLSAAKPWAAVRRGGRGSRPVPGVLRPVDKALRPTVRRRSAS